MGIIVTVTQKDLTTSVGAARGHTVLIDRPQRKGGADAGMMGGEMLLVALGGCFMSNLLEAVRTREAPISNMVAEVDGTLAKAPARFAAIEMRVSADTDDPALFEKLVRISERACICANTLAAGTELTITAMVRG